MKKETIDFLEFVISKGYSIDKSGIVYNKNGNIVNGCTDGRYKCFSVKGWKPHPKNCYFHKLQAYIKYGKDILLDKNIAVRHKNDISTDNSWDNIILGTMAENVNDIDPNKRLQHARHAATFVRKLNDLEVEKIKELYKTGTSMRVLAKMFNVSKTTISYIINKKTYNFKTEDIDFSFINNLDNMK